ncbi:MAG: aminopeptidase [Phycisphaerae bacterium]
MRGWTRHIAVSAALALALLATTTVATAQEPAADYEAIAHRLVNQCAAINEGDLVLISGRSSNQELLENVAVHVRKVGAFPLLTVTTDNLQRRLYDDVPAKYDSQTPEMMLKLARTINAVITVEAEENPALLASVPPGRIATRRRALEPVYSTMLNRDVRIVSLGNGLYPTAAKARQLGISLDELTTTFWNGVNVDYLKLQGIADTIKARLAVGKNVRITNKNGTDLQVRIERRPVHINDGVISRDDLRRGKAACQVWLPAGEVFLAPVPGTADGTVVVDRHHFRGREIRDLRLTFKNGKLTSMTAKSGLRPLKEFYDACGAGKNEFAAIDIGINPNVRIPAGSRMVAWMASGMITVGIGPNTWAGGENTSEFALFTHLPGSTLTVDKKILVENGVLKP